MALECINPPAVEPVSLSELKEYCRLDSGDTSQDLTLTELALDAREWCEAFTGRRFVQQQWRLLLDFFPGYIDLKLAGAKVSSPFVSGSNAVLVGIRYAIVLPFPPVRSLDAFNYQNANGQVTAMILGAFNIAAVSNVSSQPIVLTTDQPHGFVTGASVVIAGNAPLLALLNGGAQQVITVTSPTMLSLNGTAGTGTSISSGGTVQGFNFQQDLESNPARVAPVFGQMWPVARVVMNAVQLDYTLGYAMPVQLTIASPGKSVSVAGSPPGYQFQASDVNRPIWIPGVGPSGKDLNTIVSAVPGAPSVSATIRDAAATAVTNVTALLVNKGVPGHWSKIKRGIKVMTAESYYKRLPQKQIEDTVQKILYPVRDLR